MGRILCAWSPSWAIDNWRRRRTSASPGEPSPSRRSASSGLEPSSAPPLGELSAKLTEGDHDSPLALIENVRGVRRLAAVDEAAAGLGLHVGQKATDAAALVPELAVADVEPDADAQALEKLVDWCVRFSPAVAADGTDGLFMDISGVAHLWGGEALMLEDLRARLAANGLAFRVAVADTPGAAWALAHHGEDGTIAPPGGQQTLLAELPPAALRLDPAAAAQVERLGLRRLSQLFALPRGPFAKRFGAGALMRLDQALGHASEALAFRRPATPWFARLAFAEPISAPEDLARVASDITARLCTLLEAKGQGGRRFELAFHRLDGTAQACTVGLSTHGRDAPRIAKLFAPKLEFVDPGFGIEVATLTAQDVEPMAVRQGRLESGADAAAEDGLAPLVDRLANRLGEARVWRARRRESHVPELASRKSPVMTPATPAWNAEVPRPVRLFARPEPIEAMALIPDDPPVHFRWRGRLHRVARAEGPERVAEEWWKADLGAASVEHVRDYYCVEDQDGARFWVFRAGLYAEGQPAKWWMHGLFG